MRVLLEKYPDYQERLCILPSQLGISPDDVVKYRIRPRGIMEFAILWSRTALIVIVFALLLMNAVLPRDRRPPAFGIEGLRNQASGPGAV